MTLPEDALRAVEFGGYLADSIEAYMRERNVHDAAIDNDEEPDEDALSDHWRGLNSAIYEFRTRAELALRQIEPRDSGYYPGLPLVPLNAQIAEGMPKAAPSAPDSSQGEPLPPIEYNKEYDLYCIPLPGGWEVQMKGNGSSFRIERMAREIHAASTTPPPSSPVAANGPCDCGAARTFDEVQWPRRRLSITFTHDTCGDGLFQPLIEAAAKEYFAADPSGVAWFFEAANGVHVELRSHERLQWEKPQL